MGGFVGGLLLGCTAPRGPLVVTSPDASIKIPAMKKAVAQHDFKAIGPMVMALDSDDGAVRLAAIESLRELTGHDFDYRFYDDEDQRKPALKRWQQWINDSSVAGEVPVGHP